MDQIEIIKIKQSLEISNQRICDFVIHAVDYDLFQKYRNFYGDSFSMLLLEKHKSLSKNRAQKLIDNYQLKDFSDSQFHWEFNNYAFSSLEEQSSEDYSFWRQGFRFKNTPCTNWSALRTVVKIKMATNDAADELEKLLELLSLRQLPSGLILDDPGVKSFQYHCFTAVMLGEIYQLTQDQRIKKRWLAAGEFIIPFILPNGDGNYIGRGQLQSFGYSSLAYLLAQMIGIESKTEYLLHLNNVCHYIENSFVDIPEGDFFGLKTIPLVLNKQEGVPPSLHDMKDKHFLGWYPYNNYFDYLPFTGVFLFKAYEMLEKILPEQLGKKQMTISDYHDSHFIVRHMDNYSAVISRPDGYWSNDLLFPLVYDRCTQNFITNLNGGEQFQSSLYSLCSLPAPQWNRFSFRWRSKSIIVGNHLFLVSLFGFAWYRYRFLEDGIDIVERIFSLLPFKGTFCLAKNWILSACGTMAQQGKWSLHSSSSLHPVKTVFSASGEAILYKARRFNHYHYRITK